MKGKKMYEKRYSVQNQRQTKAKKCLNNNEQKNRQQERMTQRNAMQGMC